MRHGFHQIKPFSPNCLELGERPSVARPVTLWRPPDNLHLPIRQFDCNASKRIEEFVNAFLRNEPANEENRFLPGGPFRPQWSNAVWEHHDALQWPLDTIDEAVSDVAAETIYQGSALEELRPRRRTTQTLHALRVVMEIQA